MSAAKICSASTRRPVEVKTPGRGVAVLESRHRGDFVMPWRTDGFHKVLLVFGGRGELEIDGGVMALPGSSICTVPAGVRHRIVDAPKDELSLYGLCLLRPAVPGAEVIERVFDRPRVRVAVDLVARAGAILRRILYEERSPSVGSADLQVSLAGSLLVELAREGEEVSGDSSSERVRHFVRELERSFWKREGTDAVASRLRMSRRRFTQIFREVTGSSHTQFILDRRLSYAETLLRGTNLPVKQIVFESGFEDFSHFQRMFRRRYGCTPGELRGRWPRKRNPVVGRNEVRDGPSRIPASRR